MTKFTISGTQFRTVKKDIKLTIKGKDGKIQEDVVVGWVTLRGEDDPIYQKRVAPAYIPYQEEIELARKEIKEIRETAEKDNIDSKDVDISEPQEAIRKAIEEFMCEAVVAAIEEWDEDYFESKFNAKTASQLFLNPANNHVYNQLAAFIKERDDFLPSASAKL